MTDGAESRPEVPAQAPSSQGASTPRKRVVRFVVVFVVSVFVLLTAYRYAIPTTANDWYLFQVARHTAWMLNVIGYSGGVEHPGRIKDDPALVRARIRAWRHGEETPDTVPSTNPPAPPLTTWEAYQYRILRLRRSDVPHNQAIGPLVSFVLKPGLTILIQEAEDRLQAVENDPVLDEAARARRRDELAAELQRLKEQREAARRENSPPAVIRGMAFPFTVVPDCGAIPSMSIFLAAVLAFPTRWWKRLVGALTGVPILYFVNCFRLSCLALIGAWDYASGQGGKWFKFAHEYVWQGIYIVFVVAVWMMWVEYVVRARDKCENQPESEV